MSIPVVNYPPGRECPVPGCGCSWAHWYEDPGRSPAEELAVHPRIVTEETAQ